MPVASIAFKDSKTKLVLQTRLELISSEMIPSILGIWTVFIFTPIFNLVVFVYNITPGPSFGLTMIGLALLIRFAFLYFTLLGYKHDLQLAEIKPQMDKIQHDNRLSSKERIQKVTELTKPFGINPVLTSLPLFAQIFFLAVLYQIIQVGLKSESFHLLYPFVTAPKVINTLFFGFDLSRVSLTISLLAAGFLFVERVWEYNEKKHQSLATFSQKWDPLIWPLGSFIILILLPSAKGIFLIASVGFSMVIKTIVHLNRRA